MPRTVPIILDRARNLRFDINAIADADHHLRATMDEVLQQAYAGHGLRLSDTRALLWAGLKHEDRRLTIERTGELIQEAVEAGLTLVEIQLKLAEAIGLSGLFGNNKKKVATMTAEESSASESGLRTPDETPTAH